MSYATDRLDFHVTAATHLGLSRLDTAHALRIAQTLHTWAVHECNGTKQSEDREVSPGVWEPTGRWHWYNPDTGRKCGRTANLEAGAIKRLAALCERNGLNFEHQGDPRGYVVKIIKDGRSYGVPSRG